MDTPAEPEAEPLAVRRDIIRYSIVPSRRITNLDVQQEKLTTALRGFWEYRCNVRSEVLFENGEVGRGGCMIILASPGSLAPRVEIVAERLWCKVRGSEVEVAVRPPVSWQANGGVVVSDSTLKFTYSAHDVGGVGETTDTFILTEELLVMFGQFEHRRADGELVTGGVELRKIGADGKLLWAPSDVSTGFSIVAVGSSDTGDQARLLEVPGAVSVIHTGDGPVVIGNLTGSAAGSNILSSAEQRIEVTQGDVESLLKAMAKLSVPADDLDELKGIVTIERASGDKLPPKTAGWLARMFGKTLEGSWDVTKDVVSGLLTKLLQSYYGLKD